MANQKASQLCLRPFDIGVALRLFLVPSDRYEPMSRALITSTSAVHRSVSRLAHAGLCSKSARKLRVDAFAEFVQYGVRFAFPAVRVAGSSTAGVATACSHPDLAHLASRNDRYVFVWPQNGGSDIGDALVPLFPGAPVVASRDPRMHRLLAAIDVLRVCEENDRDAALSLVKEWLGQGTGV